MVMSHSGIGANATLRYLRYNIVDTLIRNAACVQYAYCVFFRMPFRFLITMFITRPQYFAWGGVHI